MDRAWEPIRRHLDGLYLSFETDRRPERLDDAALKRRHDPDALFLDNFPIDPLGESGSLASPRPATETP